MKTILAMAILLTTFSSYAKQHIKKIVGPSAEFFIDRNFPDAEIPGRVEGFFAYKNNRIGYASCYYPAMGGRSNGELVECILKTKLAILKDQKAEAFITKNFPDAEIPGPVEGTFTYQNGYGSEVLGHAKCYYPAMGGRSNGEVTKCSVAY